MKFRLSTLLWVTLAVACFFAGMSWDDFYEQARLAMSKKNVVVLPVGTSVTIKSKLPVPRCLVNDAELVTAKAISPTTIQLTGISPGTTTVSTWNVNTARTDYSVLVKQKSIATLLREWWD